MIYVYPCVFDHSPIEEQGHLYFMTTTNNAATDIYVQVLV